MTEELRIRFKILHHAELGLSPRRGSAGAAGWDVKAALDVPLILAAGQTFPIPTGVAIETPEGYYWEVWARSGHGVKGLDVFAGVIDEDYRGELKVILHNGTDLPISITPGERVGQLLLKRYNPCLLVETKGELSQTSRGAAGFGSTGSH